MFLLTPLWCNFATPLTGEKASHVIQHCLEAWSAWEKPKLLKTDNGPAYTSQKFQVMLPDGGDSSDWSSV